MTYVHMNSVCSECQLRYHNCRRCDPVDDGRCATCRFLDNGHVTAPSRISDEATRFWSHVEKTDDCWNWTGRPSKQGYGRLWTRVDDDGRRQIKQAHRWAYETLVGPIPEGLVIDHLCRNRLCVNPEHLEPVTDLENLMRGETLVALNSAKTHCHRGHEFTEENTYVRVREGRPRRGCRACHRIEERNRQRRLRAEKLLDDVPQDSWPGHDR
jgi:hypothetical protein